MDDFEEIGFLSPQENANLKALFEYYSEHETRRRIMKLCSQSSEDVVKLFQGALNDDLSEDFIDKVIADNTKKEQTVELIDCILTDLEESTSNSMHLLIVKLQKIDWQLPFRICISDNPNISIEIIAMIAESIIQDAKGGFHSDEARSLAYNKNASSQVLHDLFIVDDLTTRKLIAKHANTEERTLILFLNHKSIQMRRLISEAVNSTPAMQMAVLEENDTKAVEKLARNPNICDEAIISLLFSGGILPTKKRLKTFLTDNPEYFNIKDITEITGIKPKKGISIPDTTEKELKNKHLEKYKALLSEQ
ncbi:MAG: hypothetical protein KZQ85_14905 [Candidatus Thiodiazotropha sp. (ex Myrtea sp. 'scaly one' KF741663)]|nr:hypothetical protein [Candidatus Thiodiazotropha sp. (ex Myrtea sp. 'scaly one' KF741663)]